MQREYEVAVIGAGPAGGAVAAACARGGKKVALIESVAFGGVCPLRGCNPKKALLSGAEAVAMAANLRGKGVTGVTRVDWPELMAFKESFIEPVPERAENAYRELGMDTFHGLARFTGPDTLDLGGEVIRAEHIAVCPGMRPSLPPIPGIELCADSTDFLSLAELPERIAFIGGGFVAFELAVIAARAGVRVTVLVRSRPLKEFDPDLVDQLVKALASEFGPDVRMDVRLAVPTESVERTGSGLLVRLRGGETVEADLVVNAAGRVPDLEPLDLDAAGVERGGAGVTVNKYLQSVSNPRVYAAGDAADTPLALTPTAVIQARAAAANILEGNHATADHFGVPYVCFTIPPLASAGLSERQAREQGMDLEVKQGSLADTFAWKRLGETAGGYKLLVDKGSDLLVGAHLFGHMAEEMINTCALIIRGRIPLDTVRNQVWAYPTCTYQLQYMIG